MGDKAHLYNVRQIDSREVQITNKKLLDEIVKERGEDDDYTRVRVRGVFPRQDAKQFIATEDVKAAMEDEMEDQGGNIPIIMGVDVAREGNDDTVIFTREGRDGRTWPMIIKSKMRVDQTAELVRERIEFFQSMGKNPWVFIDATGVGGGVADILTGRGYKVIGINMGKAATKKETYALMVDQCWGDMQQALENRLLYLPNDRILRKELTQRYGGPAESSGFKIRMESKKHMKEVRRLSSPNRADAVSITYAQTVQWENVKHTIPRATSKREKYDPFKHLTARA